MMQKSKNKQLTFEEEHNIAMCQKAFSKDPLQLDYSNWAYLYQSMKTRGLNEKQLKKHMSKYSQTVLATIQNPHHFDKSRTTIKHKLTQLNHQLRIRLSQVFQFISMLHMEMLQEMVQYIFGGFMSTIERMAEVFEDMREEIGKLQREMDSWKFKKRNVFCFGCQKNLQQSKMRDLQLQIGTTTLTTQQPLPRTQPPQPKTQKISSQCKTLQSQLQSISQQHFFTIQSDDLVSKINQILKTRIITSQKHQSKDTTSGMLSSCLNQLNEVIRPFDIEYGAGKDQEARELIIRKGRKRAMVIGDNPLSIGDLNDTEVFTSKLMSLFAQPLHRFVLKYQTLLSNKCPTKQQQSLSQQSPIQLINQQTQTSLIKQPQAIRNLQKQLASQSRQLLLLKSTKQKIDKDLYSMYDTLKQNQTKIIQINTQNRLLQQENKILQQQLRELKNIIANNETVVIAQKQLIFKSFSQQKSQLTKQLSKIHKQLQLYRQSGISKSHKLKYQNKQIQTYKSSFQNYNSQQRSTQTGTVNMINMNNNSNSNSNDNNNYLIPFKIDRRSRHQRTFRSFKLKNNTNLQQQQQSQFQQYFQPIDRQKQQQFSNNNNSNEQLISTIELPQLVQNKKFNKTKMDLPLIDNTTSQQEKGFKSAKHFPAIQQEEDSKMGMGKTFQYRSIHQLFGVSDMCKKNVVNDSKSSIQGHFIGGQKNKQINTSINSMIPQQVEISRSGTPSHNVTPRNKSISIQSQSHSDTDNNTIFNNPSSKSNLYVSGTKLNLSKQEINKVPQISQPKIQISPYVQEKLTSASRLKDVDLQQEDVEKRPNEKNRLVIHNFNQISSTIFENKDIDQILVSKLKKVSKQQLMKQSSTLGNKIFRKSNFPTTNQTPNNQSVQNLLQINQISSKQNHNNFPYKININELSSSLQKNQSPLGISTIQNNKIRKQRVITIVNQNFQYLDEIGVISMIEQSQNKKTAYKSARQVKQNTPLNQLREILKRSQLQKLAQHIQKSDIQLFLSLQQATKYQNRAGLWNQYEATMILDNNNYNKLIQEIDAFFNYLKSNRKAIYNQYIIFLGKPNKFIKEILQQQNHNIQKQRVLKEIIKVQKTNATINKKWFIKEAFKKLIKVHKMLHKSGCNHVEKFLDKIGFYDFQSRYKTSNQRSLEKHRSDEPKPILTRNPLSIPKGLKI